MEFVQFHPSYDYSDFVEGLRPKMNEDGTMGFELQDGIFKKFVARARKNFEDSQKSEELLEKEVSVQESMTEFFSNIEVAWISLKRAEAESLRSPAWMTNTSSSLFRKTLPTKISV